MKYRPPQLKKPGANVMASCKDDVCKLFGVDPADVDSTMIEARRFDRAAFDAEGKALIEALATRASPFPCELTIFREFTPSKKKPGANAGLA